MTQRSRPSRSGLVARNAGSVSRMEALEPRLLLADELIAGIGDVNFKPVHLPDDKIEVPFTIQNLSGTTVTGKVRIQIWASEDDVIDDPGDFLCFEGNISVNVRPNEIHTKKVKARIPLDTLPRDYNFIVTVIDESMLNNGASFDTSESVDDEFFRLRWQFGEVNGRSGNTTLKFMNNSGVIYKVNFSDGFEGNEFGEVLIGTVVNREGRGDGFPGDQGIVLVFDDTSYDDKISVRRVGGPSDPDLYYLTGIFANSEFLRGGPGDDDLGFFDASGLTLYGEADFHGLHKLYLGNLLDAGQVDIDNDIFIERGNGGPHVFSDRVSIKVGDVVGTRFTITGTLANMQARSFSGLIEEPNEPLAERGQEGLGGIVADFIEKVNIQNDFEGFVYADGIGELARGMEGFPEAPDRTVGAFIVKGTVTGSMLIFGDFAKLEAGAIGEFEAAVHGRLERLNVKGDVGQSNHLATLRGAPFHTIIGATDISRVDIGGDMIESQIFAGLEFFPVLRGGIAFGNIYFGSVGNASFTSGSIGRVNVGGDMLLSEIAAGVDPDGDEFFDNPDSFLIGDSSVSRIGPIKVGGVAEAYKGGASFISGDFPDNISIDGSTYSTITNPDGIVRVVFPQT